MADLVDRIQINAVKRLHIAGGGVFEFLHAVVGVNAVFPFGDFVFHGFDHAGEGHVVRFADAHVNQRNSGILRHGFAFRPFDLLKFVDFGVLAEFLSADALGKGSLQITLRHDDSPPDINVVNKD